MRFNRPFLLPVLTTIVCVLSACRLGPDYVRPTLPLPADFKEGNKWKSAEPNDGVSRGNWWEIYADPTLNELVPQISISNQNVQATLARYRQARAAAQGARSSMFPTVGANVGAGRDFAASRTRDRYSNGFGLSLDAAWEVDLWGRVARTTEASEATLQASEALVASARLSAQADFVLNYFQLRISDELLALQRQTVATYERALLLTENRLNAGIATRADVAQARTQVLNARAQATDLGIQRAQLEHAMAILLGKAPADFSLTVAPLQAGLPSVPAGIPSSLLERRPDIAVAERRAAAANAQIGIAKAANFPALRLNASGGYEGTNLADWLTAPSRVWSLGATLAQSLFDGGLRDSLSDQAIAGFDAAASEYRQTVLGALQEVEDNLAALRILAEEADVQRSAVAAAREAEELVVNQYKAGTVSYLNVAIVLATTHASERSSLLIRARQYSANVLLIKALGGRW